MNKYFFYLFREKVAPSLLRERGVLWLIRPGTFRLEYSSR